MRPSSYAECPEGDLKGHSDITVLNRTVTDWEAGSKPPHRALTLTQLSLTSSVIEGGGGK